MVRRAYALDLLQPDHTVESLVENFQCRPELTFEDLNEILKSAGRVIEAAIVVMTDPARQA